MFNTIGTNYVFVKSDDIDHNNTSVDIESHKTPSLNERGTSLSSSSTQPKQFSITDDIILSSESTNAEYYRQFPEVVAMLKSGKFSVFRTTYFFGVKNNNSPTEVVRNLNEDFNQESIISPSKSVSFSKDPPVLISGEKKPTKERKRPVGHPVGSTKEKKRKESEDEKSAKHDIVANYMWEVQHNDISHVFQKDIFEVIYNDAKERYNLSDNF